MFVFQKPTDLLLPDQVVLVRAHCDLNILCLKELNNEGFLCVGGEGLAPVQSVRFTEHLFYNTKHLLG